MNILFISHEKKLNGSSKSMINIIETLRHKHNFYVLLPWKSGEVYDTLRNKNIQVISLVGYRNWIQPRIGGMNLKKNWLLKFPIYHLQWSKNNQKLLDKVVNTICPLQIDVIHSNTSVIDLGAKLSKKLKIPHIWHIREMGIEDFQLYPYIGWKKAYKYIGENSNKVICISDAVYQKVADRIGKEKCIRIYNGVGKENLYSQRVYRSSPIEPFKIIVAGNISKGKKQDIAIKAVRELHQRGYTQCELFIAGHGSVDNLGIDSKTLEEYIHILGQVSDLPVKRRNMDVEVVCSVCEAFGRVTVEAMMSGMPVIASASGGSLELISDGENGFLFTVGAESELANKLELLIKNPKLNEKMGRNAYHYSKKYFLIERCAIEIDAVYENVVTNNRKR